MPSHRGRREPRDPPDAAATLDIAVRFLGTRPRTRWEVEARLRRAGAEAAVVEQVLARLAELGYLDDEAFARWWGEQRDRHRPRGHRLIEAELRARGVPGAVVEAYRPQHADPIRAPGDEGLPGSEDDRARAALERHLRGRPVPSDRAAIGRLGTFLLRRGFDPETARRAIRAAAADGGQASDELPDPAE